MTDVLGYRSKIGILVPSTNSTVQPEMDDLRPQGVTNHIGRLRVSNVAFRTAEDAHRIVAEALRDLEPALSALLTCNPDHLIMGMAVPCFWGGMEGCQGVHLRMRAVTDKPLILPPEAMAAALGVLGARRVAIVTPYLPAADEHVAQYFGEAGFDVAAITGLRAPTEDQVVDITPQALMIAFEGLNTAAVDALVHVGTSIAMSRLVQEAERALGKPVVSVNIACYWAALRRAGIADRRDGFGTLLRDH